MSDISLGRVDFLSSRSLPARIGGTLALWHQRARARRELARLTERDLRDIGMSAAHATWEAGKPFWRA